ncbi:histidine kinase [Vibrio navarrensis]|uniref:alpha/beta fold hydrolase n=1 Tax=Vibrio TaxID=662 RepID=UPI0005EEA084|nr:MULTISPECIES: alpha/beta fold hydrolase [Vibrio]KJR28462.1 histidine kinase [Vibrio sp. S234-5]MBE3657944.1 histidine kinase [Vibrio navarrensis]
MSSLLNYKLEGEGQTIVLLHGLFGSLSNLGLLARELVSDHRVLSLDLRNHGLSFHSQQHDYQLMAQDVLTTMEALSIDHAVVIGHSMGAKVAMKLAAIAPQIVSQLIVLDMAPVAYQVRRHDDVFQGLHSVIQHKPTSRSQALDLLAKHIALDGVRQFLAKSLYNQDGHLAWRFNVDSLINNYDAILGWEPIPQTDIPTLFVKGGDSPYLQNEHQAAVVQQFTQAKAHVIANTGHWLHAEKPAEVLRAIRKFIVS